MQLTEEEESRIWRSFGNSIDFIVQKWYSVIDAKSICLSFLKSNSYESGRKDILKAEILDKEKPNSNNLIENEIRKLMSDIKRMSLELGNEKEANLVVISMLEKQRELMNQTNYVNGISLSLSDYYGVISQLLVQSYGYYLDLEESFKEKLKRENRDKSIDNFGSEFNNKDTIDLLVNQMYSMFSETNLLHETKPNIEEIHSSIKNDKTLDLSKIRALLNIYNNIQNNYSKNKLNEDKEVSVPGR